MSEFEQKVTQALTDAGGPPEIAEQLVAIATQHHMTHCLLVWVAFHLGEEWSAQQFERWCHKYLDMVSKLKAKEQPV